MGAALKVLGLVGMLAVATGCPSKDKKENTTPTGSGSGSGSQTAGGNPADMDPEGGLPGTGSGDPGSGDPTDPGNPGNPGDPDGSGGDGDDEPPPPEIKPPGLDLSPAEKRAQVKQHFDLARAALEGSSPDADKAISEAKKALAVDETSVDSMVILAQANIVKKFYDQALDVLRKASERGGAGNKRVHFLFGLAYDKTDSPDEAFAAYKRAVALDPSYKSALMNLGVHYLRNGRYNDAVSTYERLTGSLDYTTAAAWTNLGSAYRGQSAAPGLAEASRNRLILKAETTYKRGISRDKNYANAYYNLGLLYLDSDPFPQGSGEMKKLDRLKKAKTYFDEYRRLPGADTKRVDPVAATAQKLIEREERIQKKAEERRKREAGGN